MKIAIVDDQPILVQGLSMIVEAQKDMSVIWTAKDGEEACFKVTQEQPDVVLMDIRMPIKNGVEATAFIKSTYPDVHVIILTTFMEDDEIFDSMKHGASGYLLKDAPPESIIKAIRAAQTGGTSIEPQVASKLIKQLKPSTENNTNLIADLLTQREIEIGRAIAQGLSNREIASALFVSEGTVKNHLTHILEKLALRDRTQLAIYFIRREG